MLSDPVKICDPKDFAETFGVERRSKIRFPLELPVRYRTFGRGTRSTGEGRVVNMNRNGILVSSQHDISVGTPTELSIEWPSLLHGRIPLRFITVGEVVRCDESSFAVTLARYHFRTAKRKVTAIDSQGDSRLNSPSYAFPAKRR